MIESSAGNGTFAKYTKNVIKEVPISWYKTRAWRETMVIMVTQVCVEKVLVRNDIVVEQHNPVATWRGNADIAWGTSTDVCVVSMYAHEVVWRVILQGAHCLCILYVHHCFWVVHNQEKMHRVVRSWCRHGANLSQHLNVTTECGHNDVQACCRRTIEVG